MAIDMFLKFNSSDNIKGESVDAKHKDEIHIESVSWGVQNTGAGQTGGGLGAGKADLHDVHITKAIDKSSSALFLASCNGKHLKDAIITFRKSGEKPLDFLKVKLTEVLVSSMQFSGAAHGDKPMESLSLNFARYEMEYFTQKSDGTGEPGGNMGWDQKKAEKI